MSTTDRLARQYRRTQDALAFFAQETHRWLGAASVEYRDLIARMGACGEAVAK